MAFNKDNFRSLLEWELSLDSSDIRSHAWYHGNISRAKSELMLNRESDFLVRDCSSRVGEYVLSCRWNGILHFVVNKVVIQPNTVYERIQYTFEDEYFDTVADLITFYVGNKRPISKASGAIISRPVNRLLPLNSDKGLRTSISERSLDREIGKYQKSLPKEPHGILINSEIKNNYKRDKTNDLNALNNQNAINTSYHLYSTDTKELNDKKDENSCKIYKSNNNNNNNNNSEKSAVFDCSKDDNDLYVQYITIPTMNPPSLIDPQNFHTFLIYKNNEFLENSARNKIQNMLIETGSLIIANHLTRNDLNFLNHTSDPRDLGLGLTSGLELLLLPNGHQYRLDLLDRHKCLQYFVIISILTASNRKVRLQIIDKWIQVGLELKTALGNLFSFTAIMSALSSSYIARLSITWEELRKEYTQSAVAFESKLKPVMRGLMECSEPQAPNTTFPNIIIGVEILEKHEKLLDNNLTDDQEFELLKSFKLDLPFESTSSDYGFQIISSHLDYLRSLVDDISLFKRNGEIALNGLIMEELLLDMFRTDFHRKYLWGYRDCNAPSDERIKKFEQILKSYSFKCENEASCMS